MKITIINSKGHWKNGWVSSETDLQSLIASLERNNCIVNTFEVDSVASLENLLQDIDKDTLLLPNAYYVDQQKGSEETVWMVDIIEAHNLPFIGSNSHTLQNVLQKDVCQAILQQHQVPIPVFTTLTPSDFGNEHSILEASALTYPAIIKLTAESGSMGIDDTSIVHNQQEAVAQIQKMLQQYQQNVIVEEFLASNDITISYLQGPNGEAKLLTTWYLVTNKPGVNAVLGHKERFMLWGGVKQMAEVKDENILQQVEAIVPKICHILNIKDITRIDGRLDQQGQLRIFDVNGFPALSFPESVGVHQIISCFPEYEPADLFDALINTMVLSAASRYQMPVTKKIQQHNFFTLNAMKRVTL